MTPVLAPSQALSAPISPDLDFDLPINPSRLRNGRLSLVPFDFNYGAFSRALVTQSLEHPEMFTGMPYGPFNNSLPKFNDFYHRQIRSDRGTILFAILLSEGTVKRSKVDHDESGNTISESSDSANSSSGTIETFKVPSATFAGVVALHNANAITSTVELGQVCLLPQFLRTFVANHVYGLLFHYLLDDKSDLDLGLNEVKWQSVTTGDCNAAMSNTTDRQASPTAFKTRPEATRTTRSSTMKSVHWEAWVRGCREKVDGMMEKA